MKNTITHFNVGTALLVLLAGTAITAQAVTFSIDIGSASPFPPDDILGDPGGPGPAVVVIPAGGFAETDAFTYGEFGPTLDIFYFSVDPASAGTPATAVALEAAGAFGFGDHPADVFSSIGLGGNALAWDGDGLANPGLAPNLGLIEPIAAGPFDNLDGLDLRAPGSSIFWSVDPGTVAGSPPYAGFTPADIFVAPAGPGYSGGPFGVYAGMPALGLLPGDDIDALEIFEDGVPGFGIASDVILFSLAPGSPTLVGLGASPADILAVGGGAGPVPLVAIPAGALGLLPTDNIDAFDIVPEPSRAMLLLLGVAGTALRRRR